MGKHDKDFLKELKAVLMAYAMEQALPVTVTVNGITLTVETESQLQANRDEYKRLTKKEFEV